MSELIIDRDDLVIVPRTPTATMLESVYFLDAQHAALVWEKMVEAYHPIKESK